MRIMYLVHAHGLADRRICDALIGPATPAGEERVDQLRFMVGGC